MTTIAVLGAGVGGISAAYELKQVRKAGERIVVISDRPTFDFTPSNPWVAVGWREPRQIQVELAPLLAKYGIDFIDKGAKRVHPERNTIELGDGSTLTYDYLVIATGPRLAFDEVPGLGPEGGHTTSVCTTPHAAMAFEQWKRFVEAPGPIVVGAVQGASCFGPAYECAFIMDADLRRRKIRHRVPITLVTSEPYIGHLGLGGVGDSKGMLESELRQHHINWITNARVEKVEPGVMHVVEVDEEGQEKKRHELPFAFSMMLPAFKGVEAVFGIDGLVNPRGFVIVDAYQRNPRYPNVFATGVCVAIPPVEATPVPTGAPKTGYMIETMSHAAALNIRALIDGREPHARPTWNAICLADMGDDGIAFVAIPQIPPRNVNWMKKGKWVHLAKVAFEKYFLRKVRSGTIETFYEKRTLQLLGIEKLAS